MGCLLVSHNLQFHLYISLLTYALGDVLSLQFYHLFLFYLLLKIFCLEIRVDSISFHEIKVVESSLLVIFF